MPQTTLAAISTMESRIYRKLEPKNSQRSHLRGAPLLLRFRILAEADAIFFLVVIILFVLLRVLLPHSTPTDGGICRPFPLIAANIEKLLTDQRVTQALDRWLGTTRSETQILYIEAVFK